MTSFIKKYWIVILLLIGIGGIYSWYDPYYCYKKDKKYTDADFKNGLDNHSISSQLLMYGLVREYIHVLDENSSTTDYNEDDMKKLEAQVDEFYKKYPNNKRGGVYKDETDPAFYAFRSYQYFFMPQDIDKINDHIKKRGWGNRPMKRIVGYGYTQYYGPCGHDTFGMGDEIYEGDKSDLDDNPYKKQTINKEH